MPDANVPAPLFRDPVYDGAADPVPIWNRAERCWWLLYTNRRALVDAPGVTWVHGTDIGIASTADRGTTWKYRGICEWEPFEKGRNTYWAPEVLWHDGQYHAYVSYITGVPADWNDSRTLCHFTSKDLWSWEFRSKVALSSDRVIDACVYPRPGGRGGWYMWYKDERNHSHTYLAESDDLFKWKVVGPAITDCAHEGPNVFAWRGHTWMTTDPWDGMGVYRAEDDTLTRWKRQANILRRPGKRTDDGFRATHGDVLVQGEEAYVFYFTHPGGVDQVGGRDRVTPYELRRTSLQVARLRESGGVIDCDRDELFPLVLKDGEA